MHVYSHYTAWYLHCLPDFCLLLTVSLWILFSPSQVVWCKPLFRQNHHHSIHPLCQPEMGTLQIVNLKNTLYTLNIIVGMHQSNMRIGYQSRSCRNSWIIRLVHGANPFTASRMRCMLCHVSTAIMQHTGVRGAWRCLSILCNLFLEFIWVCNIILHMNLVIWSLQATLNDPRTVHKHCCCPCWCLFRTLHL